MRFSLAMSRGAQQIAGDFMEAAAGVTIRAKLIALCCLLALVAPGERSDCRGKKTIAVFMRRIVDAR